MARGVWLTNTDMFLSFITDGVDKEMGYGPYDTIAQAKSIATRHLKWYSHREDYFTVVKQLKPYIDLDGKPQLQWVTVWTSRDKEENK